MAALAVDGDTGRIMADALEAAGKPFERLELKDDGQGLRRESNRLQFYGAAEKFLAKQLAPPSP